MKKFILATMFISQFASAKEIVCDVVSEIRITSDDQHLAFVQTDHQQQLFHTDGEIHDFRFPIQLSADRLIDLNAANPSPVTDQLRSVIPQINSKLSGFEARVSLRAPESGFLGIGGSGNWKRSSMSGYSVSTSPSHNYIGVGQSLSGGSDRSALLSEGGVVRFSLRQGTQEAHEDALGWNFYSADIPESLQKSFHMQNVVRFQCERPVDAQPQVNNSGRREVKEHHPRGPKLQFKSNSSSRN